MTYTPSNVIQYNEYYPFGMNTANSWTRENTTGNNFLGNGGTEFNNTSNPYDLDYRNYDPILGRMNGVDPMATKYASLSPYNFSFNDPVTFNDPSGADADPLAYWKLIARWVDRNNTRTSQNARYTRGVVGDDDLIYGNSFPKMGFGAKDFVYDYENDKYVLPVFGHGGWGYWQKRRTWDYSTENFDEEGSGDMATLIMLPDLFVPLKHSLSHYRTMANPIVQRMHAGSREFAAHPFGGGLLAFVSGGGLFGAGSGALARLGAKQFLMNGARTAAQLTTRVGTRAATNLLNKGVTNMVINGGAQLVSTLASGGKLSDIDIADIAISGVTGNFVTASLGGSLVNYTAGGDFSTGFSNPTKGLTDLSVGIVFGSITGQVGLTLGTKNVGAGWKNVTNFTIEMYSNAFNYTISGGQK